MTEPPVIEMRGVKKSFGRTQVLRGVDLHVPAGQTFAFLGRNGAGKTTSIRMMLGLLSPDSGEIRILGMDPRTQALEIRRRVGYVAEDPAMFGWMRVSQILSFVSPFYPTWDAAWAKNLTERFELPLKTRIKNLSKGQAVRVALLLALAHRPELVILDDPTLGLDPIMRKEFLRDLVGYLQGERVSVFFSSHLLYEIEPVADSVVILDRGRVIRQAATEDLRAHVKRVLAPVDATELLEGVPGILDFQVVGRQVSMVVENIAAARLTTESAGVEIQEVDLNLDEIFEAYVIGRPKDGHHAQPPLERMA
ncbi:MAG TPA: ABC transporter ATP-binding protein [Tepidisphaeraceae bacterium]|nr:ABC transporter ATP-binding protein [Tepidisphaeraceae bacterium]